MGDKNVCHVNINTEMEEITPLKVRDEIIECFYGAHCADSSVEGTEGEKRIYCQGMVKKAFKDTEGDFDNPTKESIEEVLKSLAEFSKSFRDPEMIKKHVGEIMELVNKLE